MTAMPQDKVSQSFLLARALAVSAYVSVERAQAGLFAHLSGATEDKAGIIFFKITSARSRRDRRYRIRIVTFEACSGFTHVTARRIAQPPKAAFVTRLQPCRLPDRTARQLPDQSTTLWVESSST